MVILKITMLLIGSIIGAGFATGAEIVTFFQHLALPAGVIALLVCVAMFSIISLSIYLSGRSVAMPRWLNIIFIGLYFILFTAMTAGVTQITGIGVSILALLVSSIIVLFGFEQMTHLNMVIVGVIIVALIGICVPALRITTFAIKWADLPQGTLWAFLYAGLNCFMFPELINAARHQYTRKALYWAGLITAIIIAGLVYLILSAIRSTGTQTAILPLLAIANHPLTMIVILLAMITSQYAALFALIERLNTVNKSKAKPTKLVLITAVIAFSCSFFGFKPILNFAYPLIGAVTCVYLLYFWVRSWVASRAVLD